MKRIIMMGLIMLVGIQTKATSNKETPLPQGFVYLKEVDSSIDQKVEFATDENILGYRQMDMKLGASFVQEKLHLRLQRYRWK